MALLADMATERALLAALLVSPQNMLGKLLVEEKLRPEHFASPGHSLTFQAMASIADRGERADTLTLTTELELLKPASEPGALVADLLGVDMDVTAYRSYARRVRDLHRRRDLKLAAALLGDAADLGDAAKLAEAEAIMTAPDDSEPTTWSAADLSADYEKSLDQPAAQTFHWPFFELNSWTGGGMRRKQVILIGGWTSNGKSVLYDQILEKLADQGLRVHSYINEMSKQERMDRTVARLSGVPFSKVYARTMDALQYESVLKCLKGKQIKVGMTECAGWTAPEIARHISWNRWDVAGVDIVHEIAHREERDLAEIAQTLRAAAKRADCILIACVHLNDNRVTTPQRPIPVMRDVRGSGMLVRGADVVLLIHRDDNEKGIPQPEGALFAPKIRNGHPDAMKVQFDAERMRFLPVANGMTEEPTISTKEW